MSQAVSIKLKSSFTTDCFVEKDYNFLNTIMENKAGLDILLLHDNDTKTETVSIIKNLLNNTNVEDFNISRNDINSLNSRENTFILAIGNENLIEELFKIKQLSIGFIPTSIRAMVDFSIYTAESGAEIAFIYLNSENLISLSDKDFYNNFSYIMRLGIIKNLKFYVWLVDNLYEICDKEIEALEELLNRSLQINKAIIEGQDLTLYNFGKEFAEAFYKVLNNEFTQGQCLALGMIASAYVSWKLDLIKMEYFYELRDMFVPFNLPISYECKKLGDIFKAFSFDNAEKEMSLIKAIGRSTRQAGVSDELVKECIDFINFDMD